MAEHTARRSVARTAAGSLVLLAALLAALLVPAAVPNAFAQVAAPVAAAPAAGAPPGWTVVPHERGVRLTWRAPRPVPLGDADVEFATGSRTLGTPQASRDRRSFTLDVTGLSAGEVAGLQVRAAGRRLDAPATAARRGAPPAVPRRRRDHRLPSTRGRRGRTRR